jgi:AraC-like DNA-binding protein
MLRYLALGERSFEAVHDTLSQRLNWEFFILFEGECWPQFKGKKLEGYLKDANFWVTRPMLTYKWYGNGHPCHRAVLHFSSVPSEFACAMPDSGVIAAKLSNHDLEQAKQIVQNLLPDYAKPNEFSPLVFDRGMLDVVLLAIRCLSRTSKEVHLFEDHASDRVEQAVMFYQVNLHRNPKMSEISEAVHLSTSQLRRLFLQVKRQSPLDYLRKLRMKRISEHLATSDDTLEDIAKVYSFSDNTDLCRCFKAVFGVSPNVWRKNYAVAKKGPQESRAVSNLGMLIIPPRNSAPSIGTGKKTQTNK